MDPMPAELVDEAYRDWFRRNMVWRFGCEWLGWRRALWLAVQLDFDYKRFGVVLFGLHLGYGLRVREDAIYTSEFWTPCHDDRETSSRWPTAC